jgi:N utilization substance protein A
MMAQLLATEGFNSVEEVAFVEEDELATLEGFDNDLAAALQQRANDYLDARDVQFDQQRVELGVTEELSSLEGLTPGMLVKLGENGIKELDDFAELATDELVDPNDGLLREFELDKDTASAMIMVARAPWFADEEQPAVPVDAMEPGANGAAADAAGTDEA